MDLLQTRKVSEEASHTQLIGFPHAGGDTVMFRDWRKLLAPEIEVAAFRMPGRGLRLEEPMQEDLVALARDIAAAMGEQLTSSYGLMGHSFGAILAFEVARNLVASKHRAPDYLIVSAAEPPQFSWHDRELFHLLEHDPFLDKVIEMGGVPEELLPHREFLDGMVPLIRADIKCLETYRYHEGPPLETPTLVLGGKEDNQVKAEALSQWARVLAGEPSLKLFPGGHFYYHQNLEDICAQVKAWILKQLP